MLETAILGDTMAPARVQAGAPEMNQKRWYVGAAIVLVAIIATACGPQPTGPTTTLLPASPPYCPFDAHLVMFGGDSLATQWPNDVTLTSGTTAFNTAVGGSAYGGSYTSGVDTIGDRVLAQLNNCGNDVAVAALSGGVNDISQGQPVATAIAGIRALDVELHARGVHAVFLTIHPVPDTTAWFAANQSRRRQINTWMTTPGNMFGTVVNCSPFLESSPGSDILARPYGLRCSR